MTVAVRDPVAAMSRGLDELRATLSGLDDKGVTHTLRDIEALSRTTQSVMLDVVAEAEARGIAVREGFGTTAGLVAAMLHLSGADARTRVEHAAMVGTRRTTTGETLAPKLPATSGRKLLPLVPDAPSTGAPAGMGYHHSGRTRRIPTTHNHRPIPAAADQSTPSLIVFSRTKNELRWLHSAFRVGAYLEGDPAQLVLPHRPHPTAARCHQDSRGYRKVRRRHAGHHPASIAHTGQPDPPIVGHHE